MRWRGAGTGGRSRGAGSGERTGARNPEGIASSMSSCLITGGSPYSTAAGETLSIATEPSSSRAAASSSPWTAELSSPSRAAEPSSSLHAAEPSSSLREAASFYPLLSWSEFLLRSLAVETARDKGDKQKLETLIKHSTLTYITLNSDKDKGRTQDL